MRRILVSASLLSLMSISLLAVPTVQAEEPTRKSFNTYRAHFSQAKSYPDRSAIRTYVVDILADVAGEVLCDSIYDFLKKELFDDLAPANIIGEASVMESCDDGLVDRFGLTMFLEPKTGSDQDAFAAFMEEHSGVDLWGTPLQFEQALNTIHAIEIRAGNFDQHKPDWFHLRNGRSVILHTHNYGDAWLWDVRFEQEFLSEDPEDMIALMVDLIGPFADQYYRGLLEEVEAFVIRPAKRIVMADGRLMHGFMQTNYVRE